MKSALGIHQDSSESVSVPILKAAEVGERWPVLLWFYLKTLGLYHSGKGTTIALNYLNGEYGGP